MTVLVKGIIHVTGEPDTGKTTFALECGAPPEKICLIDNDIKGRATVNEIRESYQKENRKFGHYVDFTAAIKGKTQLQVYDYGLQLIESIASGKFEVIVWDTWTRFAGSMKPFVRQNPTAFRHPKDWAARGDFKGGQQWKEAHQLEASMLSELQQRASTVIVVTHLKDTYVEQGGKSIKTGKMIPACSRTLVRVPRLRVWLQHNENSPVPVGLVLKRLDKKVITEKGLRTVSVLPRKIVPRDGHRSLWDTIEWYYENPIDQRAPTAQETPNEYELSVLDNTLTADQKRTLELMLRAGAVSNEPNEPETEQVDPAILAHIKSLKAKGETLSAIAGKVGMGAGEVARALREAR